MDKLRNVIKLIVEDFDEFNLYCQQLEENQLTLDQFVSRTDEASQLWVNFNDTYLKLIEKVKDEADLQILQGTRRDVSRKYRVIKEKHDAAKRNNPDPKPKVNAAQETHRAVTLPQLTLPKFDGNLLKFVQFRNLFDAAVKSDSLTDAQRLQYLIASLHDEPLALVRHLDIIDEHYAVAWSILKDKYENQQIVTELHICKLLNVPQLTSAKLDKLQTFYAYIVENIKALEASKVSTKEFVWFVIVASKLDQSIRAAFERQHDTKKPPTIDDLLAFIQGEIRALQASTDMANLMVREKPTGAVPKAARSPPVKKRVAPSSAQSFMAQSADNRLCSMCKSRHNLYFCDKFRQLSIAQRRNFVKQKRLCFNCLGASHSVSTCPSKTLYRHCRAAHHLMLHIEPAETMSTSETFQPSETSQDVSSMNSDSNNEKAVSLFADIHTPSTVLLATAEVHATDHHGRLHLIRVVLDTGSQTSYITRSCAQRLCLPQHRSRISASGLGGSSIETCGREVRLNITNGVGYDDTRTGPRIHRQIKVRARSGSKSDNNADIQ